MKISVELWNLRKQEIIDSVMISARSLRSAKRQATIKFANPRKCWGKWSVKWYPLPSGKLHWQKRNLHAQGIVIREIGYELSVQASSGKVSVY